VKVKKTVRKFTIEAFGATVSVNVDKTMAYPTLRDEIKSLATKPIRVTKVPYELFVVNKDDNSKLHAEGIVCKLTKRWSASHKTSPSTSAANIGCFADIDIAPYDTDKQLVSLLVVLSRTEQCLLTQIEENVPVRRCTVHVANRAIDARTVQICLQDSRRR
jgi:hypothetical protein